MTIEVPVMLADGAVLPTYQTEGAAGMDVCTIEDIELAPLDRTLAPTGLRMAIPPGYEAQIRPRSGLAIKHGLTMANSPGTIDSDFRGEIKIILINLGKDVVKVEKGTRIAQIVFSAVSRVGLRTVDCLEITERGEGGFGSTGVK